MKGWNKIKNYGPNLDVEGHVRFDWDVEGMTVEEVKLEGSMSVINFLFNFNRRVGSMHACSVGDS